MGGTYQTLPVRTREEEETNIETHLQNSGLLVTSQAPCNCKPSEQTQKQYRGCIEMTSSTRPCLKRVWIGPFHTPPAIMPMKKREKENMYVMTEMIQADAQGAE